MLNSFISQKMQMHYDDTMVTIKIDADAKVKGTGTDGALNVQVSGQESSPVSAKISGDVKSPIALGPIEVAPITVIPDLTTAAKSIDFGVLITALKKLSEGVSVDLANSKAPLSVAPISIAPLSIALAKIPVDLTISVSSPTQEAVFKVEIKGTIGE
jgi:hypothetical protein